MLGMSDIDCCSICPGSYKHRVLRRPDQCRAPANLSSFVGRTLVWVTTYFIGAIHFREARGCGSLRDAHFIAKHQRQALLEFRFDDER